MDRWNPDTLEKFQMATGNAVREFVIQGDSVHAPTWFKERGATGKLLTQFMRFPLIAHTTLLRRGMTEEQAQLIGGAIASTMTMFLFKYLREQAAVKLGFVDPLETKYDFTKDDEQLYRGIYESFLYASTLGMFTNIADAMAQITLGQRVGSKYGQTSVSTFLGPAAGKVDYLLRMMPHFVEGKFGERELNFIKSMLPFQNLPLINEGWKALNEELDFKYGGRLW
jgi:hypothetical protein